MASDIREGEVHPPLKCQDAQLLSQLRLLRAERLSSLNRSARPNDAKPNNAPARRYAGAVGLAGMRMAATPKRYVVVRLRTNFERSLNEMP